MNRVLLALSCLVALVSSALPPFTITGIADGIDNGADIARTLMHHLAANEVFDHNDGPALAEAMLAVPPFVVGDYQFTPIKLQRGGSFNGCRTATVEVEIQVSDGKNQSMLAIEFTFKHQRELETPEYANMTQDQYVTCKKLYRPTQITVKIDHA